MKQISIIKNQQLKPHEQINRSNLIKIYTQIKADHLINDPIIVDKKTYVILDGHHRYKSLVLLGLGSSPVYLC